MKQENSQNKNVLIAISTVTSKENLVRKSYFPSIRNKGNKLRFSIPGIKIFYVMNFMREWELEEEGIKKLMHCLGYNMEKGRESYM